MADFTGRPHQLAQERATDHGPHDGAPAPPHAQERAQSAQDNAAPETTPDGSNVAQNASQAQDESAGLTFAAACDLWLADVQVQAAGRPPSSQARADAMVARVRRVLIPAFGSMPLVAIDAGTITAWQAEASMSAGAMSRYRATLSRAWRWFRARGLVDHDPMRAASTPALVSPPTTTRAGCDAVRGHDGLCSATACRFHNGVSTEREGRPRVSTVDAKPIAMRPAATCALDLAERGGMSRADVGREIGVSGARVRQIELRAIERMRVATMIDEHIVELQARLPSGWTITTAYPASSDPSSVYVMCVATAPTAPTATALVQLRKRR